MKRTPWLLFLLITSSAAQSPQIINYQGRLVQGTNLVNGTVGLSLRLYNVPGGGTSIYEDSNSVTVADGLYSTFIGDNPANATFLSALTNVQVWLEVAVNGSALTPRELLAAVAYARVTEGLRVTSGNGIILNPIAGTNTIHATALHATISGGALNDMGSNSSYSTVAGGVENNVDDFTAYACIGGGQNNNIGILSPSTVIGGGSGNSVADNSGASTVAGGQFNDIGSNALFATVGGGSDNNVGANSPFAVIPGGRANAIGAGATNAFAAGRQAKANHHGSFVWADNSAADFASTAPNQFLIRASGGVGIGSASPDSLLHISAGTVGDATVTIETDTDNVGENDNPGILLTQDGGLVNGLIALEGSAGTRATNTLGNAMLVGSEDAIPVQFLAGDAARMTILTSGQVGIGTTVASELLTVAGNTLVTGSVTAASFSGDGLNVTNVTPVNNSITSVKIVDGSVSGTDIANGSVSNVDLAAASVNSASVLDGSLTGTDIANGTISNADVAANTFWETDGNAGTTDGTHFLGTTDNQPLELRVNNVRAMRIAPSNGAPNIILGAEQNSIADGTRGASILGGSNNTIDSSANFALIAGGFSNKIGTSSTFSAIGGGFQNEIRGGLPSGGSVISGGNGNTIGTNNSASVIAGGGNNDIGASSGHATIGGGITCRIGDQSLGSTIAGGDINIVESNSPIAFIGGGNLNKILHHANGSTVSGGRENIISNDASYAVIPGGRENFIGEGATNALAAGFRASANHRGAFVWSDQSSFSRTSSTNEHSWTVRAIGGARFITAISNNGTVASAAILSPGSGSWASMSDRNAKENFEPVDSRDVLDRVAALPITTWNMKTQDPSVRHIGPMAQDFASSFGVGESERYITGTDADGVTLAAIQGLHRMVLEQQKRIEQLEEELKRR